MLTNWNYWLPVYGLAFAALAFFATAVSAVVHGELIYTGLSIVGALICSLLSRFYFNHK